MMGFKLGGFTSGYGKLENGFNWYVGLGRWRWNPIVFYDNKNFNEVMIILNTFVVLGAGDIGIEYNFDMLLNIFRLLV